jgi:hypothetical protein
MNDPRNATIDLIDLTGRADEDMLISDVSDEALEFAALGRAGWQPTILTSPSAVINCCW